MSMVELKSENLSVISGGVEVDWNTVGRDFVVAGASIAGTVFCTGLAAPMWSAIGAVIGAGAGALYDWASDDEGVFDSSLTPEH